MAVMNNEQLPWYRQFWAWFVFILPATVVVAGITTVIIATRYSDNLVVDNYYKEGLAINRYLAQDQYAQAHGLSAELHFGASQHAQITLHGLAPPPDHLLLHWQHPTSSALDFSTVLLRDDRNHYSGELSQRPKGRWYLNLGQFSQGPEGSPWRLKAEIVLAEAAAGDAVYTLAARPDTE